MKNLRNSSILFCFLLIFIQSFQIIYFNRHFFKNTYDVLYWKDRFEHSQWVLPLSKRIIGDDGLFSYIGYGLINGASLTGFNTETPPLGKYLIGLSIVMFKNPAYYALFFGIGSLFFFYVLAKGLLGAKIFALFAVAFLLVDPLLINQFWRAWVDIIQLFFLMLNLFFFFMLLRSKAKSANILSFICGVSLGLFAETKPPVLLPIIIFLESALFIYKKKIRIILLFIIGLLVGIILPYSKFFLDGNSFLDFIKLNKYVIAFYLKSQVVVHKDAIWQTIFLGKFPNISGSSFTSVSEWWIMWPIIGSIGILSSLIFIFKKDVGLIWKGISVFVLSSLIIYTLIPAYPRYLVIILPFFYLLFVKAIMSFIGERRSIFILGTILIYGTIHTAFFLQPKPEMVLNNFYYNLSNQYFQDIYQESISKVSHPKMSREKFRLLTQRTLENATIKAIEVKETKRNIPTFGDKGEAKINVTYKTQRLGSFSENKDLKLVKEDNQWKIVWNWNLVMNGFLPEYDIVTTEDQGKRGRILDSKGNVLAEDSMGYLIVVNPEEIDLKKENDMLSFLSQIGHVKGVHLQNAYLENALHGSYVSLFTLFTDLVDDLEKSIFSFSGIKIIPHVSRIYKTATIDPLNIENVLYKECCTRIYSSYNYHGVKGAEKQYDNILSGHDGGSIVIKDNKNNVVRAVITKSKKDGRDIMLLN